MSEWYDNRSAEVVLRQPSDWSNERKCLDGYLKRLKPQERELIWQVYGENRSLSNLAATAGVSVAQLLETRSRLANCMKKCIKEIEWNAG
jgi:DNA-directed RNA polymerase specialized sigma24 family protein